MADFRISDPTPGERLDDIGREDAPEGSADYQRWLKFQTISMIDAADTKAGSLSRNMKYIKDREYYKLLYSSKKTLFKTWEEFCSDRRPWGFNMNPEVAARIMRERDPDLKVAVLLERYETTAPARPVGRPRVDDSSAGKKGDNITFKNSRGTSGAYAVARSKRDRPDLADKIVRGELTPHKAAVEAGFRKPMAQIRVDCVDVAARALVRYFGSRSQDLINAMRREIRRVENEGTIHSEQRSKAKDRRGDPGS